SAISSTSAASTTSSCSLATRRWRATSYSQHRASAAKTIPSQVSRGSPCCASTSIARCGSTPTSLGPGSTRLLKPSAVSIPCSRSRSMVSARPSAISSAAPCADLELRPWLPETLLPEHGCLYGLLNDLASFVCDGVVHGKRCSPLNHTQPL